MLLFRLNTSAEIVISGACVTFTSMRLPKGPSKGTPKGTPKGLPEVLVSIRMVIASGTVTGSVVITVVGISSEGIGAVTDFVGQQTIDLSLAFFNRN